MIKLNITVIHTINLKQALKNDLVLRKIYGVIKLNQNVWLKPYINVNTDLRKEAKTDYEKYYFKLMNNAVFGKTMENMRKHKEIELATTEKRRNYLVLESNYHTTKVFREHLLAIEMRTSAILELNKILMYQFWYDYAKPKYGEKAKLCYMDTDMYT